MSSELKSVITESVKDAMRAKDKPRLAVLRMITAEIKNIEVNERIDVDDQRLLIVLDKMVKQRRDSARQYADNGRPELAEQEQFEIEVIQAFLPKQLSEEELRQVVSETAGEVGATSMADMGKLMAALKPKVQGRADMGQVGQIVKAQLT